MATTTATRIHNFSAGPADPAGRGAGTGAARPDVAARRRHVDPRDQPPLGGVRRGDRRLRSRCARPRQHSRQLSRPLPAGRRQPAVLDGPDEPAAGGWLGRLPRHRRLGREGGQGSAARREGQHRRLDRGREAHARAARRRAEARPECRLRAPHHQQHDLRHAVAHHPRHRQCSARRRHVFGHVQPADRHLEVRVDLRGRAEESRTVRRHARHRPRGPARAHAVDAADDAAVRGARGEQVALQHAAGVRHLHHAARAAVADQGRRPARRSRRSTSARRASCTRRSTAPASIAATPPPTAARG